MLQASEGTGKSNSNIKQRLHKRLTVSYCMIAVGYRCDNTLILFVCFSFLLWKDHNRSMVLSNHVLHAVPWNVGYPQVVLSCLITSIDIEYPLLVRSNPYIPDQYISRLWIWVNIAETTEEGLIPDNSCYSVSVGCTASWCWVHVSVQGPAIPLEFDPDTGCECWPDLAFIFLFILPTSNSQTRIWSQSSGIKMDWLKG